MSWKLLLGGTMASTGTVTGGADYTGYMNFETWQLNLSTKHMGGIGQGDVVIPNKAVARPRCGQLVTLQDLAAGNNLWAGVIHQVDQEEWGGLGWCYHLKLSDLSHWLTQYPAGNVVYGANGSTTTDQIVTSLISDWVNPGNKVTQTFGRPTPNITIFPNHIYNSGVVSPPYYPNFIPVSQAIDYLAKVSNCIWFVDASANVWFVPATSGVLSAPLSASPLTVYWDMLQQQTLTLSLPLLDLDNNATGGPGDYFDCHIIEDISQTISAVWVRGFSEVTTTQITESPTSSPPNTTLVGTSSNSRVFSLNQQPVPPTFKGYMTVTATVGGVVTTYNTANGNLKTEFVDGQPSDGAIPTKTVYVNPNGNTIRFNGPGATQGAPDNGTNITVVYNYYQTGMWPQLQTGPLAGKIQGREGFGNGDYYDIITSSALTDPISIADGLTAWQAAASLDLAKYGLIPLKVTFKSRTKGWLPGQQLFVKSANRGDNALTETADAVNGLSYTGWTQPTFLNKFYVTQVTLRLVNDTHVYYEIEAAVNLWGD